MTDARPIASTPPTPSLAPAAPHAGTVAGAYAAPFPLMRRALMNASVLGIAEALTLAFSLMLGGFIRTLWKGDPMFASWMLYLVIAWVIGAAAVRLLPGWGLGPAEELRRTVMLLVTVFGGTTAMLFWGKAAGETSRFTLTTAFLISLVLVPAARLKVKRMMLDLNLWGIPAVVYGDESSSARLLAALREERGLGFIPVGVFSDHLVAGGVREIAGVPVLGTKSDLTRAAPAAIFALPSLPRERATGMIEKALSTYRTVVLIPDLLDTPSLWVVPRDIVGTLGLEISSNLLDPLSKFLKRAFELGAVLLTAPVWVPLCLLIGTAIWLRDRSSPLFLQERVGRDGQPFLTWKFRTMHPDAEALLKKRLDEDPDLRREWEGSFKLRNDPRITALGQFLRLTSLDEIPQFVNVLRGEMSLVGPRPLPEYHQRDLPESVRRLRERVRPGMTGLWQVSGRSDAGTAGMARWDTYYVRNWSIWLDIVIIVRTFRTVLSRRGAM